MKKIFRFVFLLSILTIYTGLHAQTRTFEVDGINYRVVREPDGSMATGTVHVCALEYGEYEGDIVIPNVVKETADKYADRYKVVGVDNEAFAQAKYLNSVQLSPSIETIGEDAFRLSSVKKVILPMGNLTRINNYAFAQTKIGSIDIPSTVKALGRGAFSNCNMLKSVVLHEGLSTIEDESFYACSHLETVKLPNSLKSIGNSAFEKCSRLVKMKLGTRLKGIGNRTFYGCVRLRRITLPDGLREIGNEAFAQSGIVEIAIPESIRVVKAGCFAGSMLRRVALPKGLKSVEDHAFENCILDTLIAPSEAIVSPKANIHRTEEILNMQEVSEETFMFPERGCELTKVLSYLEKNINKDNCLRVNYSEVKSWGTTEETFSKKTIITIKIGGLLYMPISYAMPGEKYGILVVLGGDSIRGEVKIPESIEIVGGPYPEKYIIAGIKVAAFYGKGAISNIILPNSICILGVGINAFRHVSGLKECHLPDNMEVIPSGMFAESGIRQIVFPRKLKEISESAFWGANRLTAISVPEGVVKIKSSAFAACRRLNLIVLPESLEEIGRGCFEESNEIEKIKVPKNVKKIGRHAFDSDKLNYVEICGNPCDWDLSGLHAFGNNIFGDNDQLRIVVESAKYKDCKALEQYSRRIEVKE